MRLLTESERENDIIIGVDDQDDVVSRWWCGICNQAHFGNTLRDPDVKRLNGFMGEAASWAEYHKEVTE